MAQSISLEIQRASQLNLWVGLPHFLADTPNPITITSAVTGMVARIAAQVRGLSALRQWRTPSSCLHPGETDCTCVPGSNSRPGL